jgi:hypothetical protein
VFRENKYFTNFQMRPRLLLYSQEAGRNCLKHTTWIFAKKNNAYHLPTNSVRVTEGEFIEYYRRTCRKAKGEAATKTYLMPTRGIDALVGCSEKIASYNTRSLCRHAHC